MFRAIGLFLDLQLPKSTKDHYYFRPAVVTLGNPGFDPSQMEDKCSREEFMELRKKIIETGGRMLGFATSVFYLRYVCVILGLAFFVFRLVTHFTGFDPFGTYGFAILVGIVLLPNIAIACLWTSMSRQLADKIQLLLDQQNKDVFATRGLCWKISRNLLYMTLAAFVRHARYKPPQGSPDKRQESPEYQP